MNLTRPEKKEWLCTHVYDGVCGDCREMRGYNSALSDMSAYQNQQMEVLEDIKIENIFQGIWNSAKVWKGSPKEDKIQAQCFHESKKDLATQIRKMIGGGDEH